MKEEKALEKIKRKSSIPEEGETFEEIEHAYDIAINALEKQKNNGWIPCSERLPEIRKDCLVTVKYTGFMGMNGFWMKTGH